MYTIKPIDKEAIIKAANETGAIITVEEHQAIGGLGSAVAEVVVNNNPVKMKIIGMNDSFGQSGEPDELLNYYKLNSEKIIFETVELIKSK